MENFWSSKHDVEDINGNTVAVYGLKKEMVGYAQWEIDEDLYTIRYRAPMFKGDMLTPFYAEYEEEVNMRYTHDYITDFDKVKVGELRKWFDRVLGDMEYMDAFERMVLSNKDTFTDQLKNSFAEITLSDEEMIELIKPYMEFKNYEVVSFDEQDKETNRYIHTIKNDALASAQNFFNNTRRVKFFVENVVGVRVYEKNVRTGERIKAYEKR